jgi:hypothetical protein
MAKKKKKSIALMHKDISFTENGITYKLLRFKPENMSVDVLRLENDTLLDEFTLPFAHLPKALKKVLKPK